jgi:hypothetical protein
MHPAKVSFTLRTASSQVLRRKYITNSDQELAPSYHNYLKSSSPESRSSSGPGMQILFATGSVASHPSIRSSIQASLPLKTRK